MFLGTQRIARTLLKQLNPNHEISTTIDPYNVNAKNPFFTGHSVYRDY